MTAPDYDNDEDYDDDDYDFDEDDDDDYGDDDGVDTLLTYMKDFQPELIELSFVVI